MVILSISAFASEKDTSKRNKPLDDQLVVIVTSDSVGLTKDSTVIADVIDSVTLAEVIAVEEAIYLNNDILYFAFDEIPVTQDLFEYHCSLMDFQVPMQFNHLVKTQIDYYGTRWQIKLKEMVTKSQYFFPLYEQILAENELPMEIKYLSIIESGLNPNARSRSGAVGAWQFMPATARIFDLKINYDVDERKSLDKSTRAACTYLKQMYNQYDDWLVALASYNCGPGNVRKAMRLSGSRDFWGMYKYLPRETQNYVPKFIAMTYMMNFYQEYGIVPSPIADSLYRSEEIFCKDGYDFEIIAERLGITNEQLLNFNPELKKPRIPYKGEGYLLKVPQDLSYLFYENEQDIEAISIIRTEEKRIAEANKPKAIYHYVRPGESLGLIARNRGVTVSQLKKWNGLRSNTIHPKQRLKIYR